MLVASIREQNAAADISSGYDVRILRDRWGVPHVFGKKDTDAAFGLAYAHAEDDFKTMQLVMMAVGGRLASVLGPKGGGYDYLVNLIRLLDTVNARYETDLDPRTRALCEAYADGVKPLRGAPSAQTVPGLGRVTGSTSWGVRPQDALMLALSSAERAFEKPKTAAMRRSTPCSPLPSGRGILRCGAGVGSIAIAVSPRRSAGGETMLAINSHQPWEGPVTGTRPQCTARREEHDRRPVFGLARRVPRAQREFGWAHTN